MAKAPNATRILVLDDHPLFREALGSVLSAEADLELAAQCGSIQDAVPLLTRLEPDLVLLDLELAGERGTYFCRLIRELGFRSKVLVLTAGLREQELVQILAQGAAGIVLKSNHAPVLLEAIRTVAAGGTWVDPKLVSAPPAAPHQELLARLTARERTVLLGIADGLSNKEIATQLGISEGSVKSSVQQLFTKTAVRTRGQLIRFALEFIRGRSGPESA